jgi:hypothetical protein
VTSLEVVRRSDEGIGRRSRLSRIDMKDRLVGPAPVAAGLD